MRVIRNILLIALAMIVQSTLIGQFPLFGVRPDLAMVVFLLIAKDTESVGCIFYGFFIGFLQDVYTPEYLGFNSLSMSLIGFIAGFLREHVTVENTSVRLIMTFFICILHDIIFLFMYSHFDMSLVIDLFWWEYLAGALYTGFVAVVVLSAWDWLEKGGLLSVFVELMGYRK